MITIVIGSRCPRIDITNDVTFEDVRIECRDWEEEKEMVISIVKELMKNE